VSGSRAVEIEGRQESIDVSGWVDPRDVEGDRTVSFSRVADARLVYRTFLSSARDVLTAADIEEVLAALPQTPEAASVLQPAGPGAASTPTPAATPAAAAAGGAAAATPAPPPAPPSTSYALTDRKKLELLLLYLNRLVDLVFSR
jgi:hypothetical protein